jgi:MFS family permease
MTIAAASLEKTAAYPPSLAAGRFAMIVLLTVNVVGYLDRQILSLLVQPVKAALGLSDGLIGIMQGAAFVLTFGIASLFVGRLVDRSNRRNLLLICIAIWTIGAAAGGLAQNGWQLFVARMAVGAGEAALVPCAVSLIGDYFVAEHRGRAVGLFSTGIYAGAGLSLLLVGFAMPHIDALARHLATAGMRIESWRLVLVALLLPGIFACLLLAMVQEPGRTVRTEESVGPSGLRDWTSRARMFLPHHIGWAMANICQYAIAGWLPTILIREHGFDVRDAGLTYGSVMAVLGVGGALIGGALADRIARRSGPIGRLMLAPLFTALATLGFLCIGISTSATNVLLGAALVAGGMGVMMVIGLVSLSDFAPPRSRGQITSIYLTVITVIAAAGGPAAVGYGNDMFGGPGLPLSCILAIVGVASSIAAIAFILLAMRAARHLTAAAGRP